MSPDRSILEKALEIRYVQLVFVIQFPEDCVLPAHKASALRGGMGQRLLEQDCVRDRDCEHCDFEEDCLVRRIMYAKNKAPVRYGGRGESNGYIISCENSRTVFHAGERMTFRVTLFGRVIPYFAQILQAFYQLGLAGLGKEHASYRIAKVENEAGEAIVQGANVYMRRYRIRTVREYASERVQTLKGEDAGEYTLHFAAPTSIKSEGQMIRSFQAEPFIRAIMRRIYTMDCYEGLDIPLLSWEEAVPEAVWEQSRIGTVPRYSSAHEGHITLSGLTGELAIRGVTEEMLMCLAAGEILHVGSNTSFGFGRYQIQPRR